MLAVRDSADEQVAQVYVISATAKTFVRWVAHPQVAVLVLTAALIAACALSHNETEFTPSTTTRCATRPNTSDARCADELLQATRSFTTATNTALATPILGAHHHCGTDRLYFFLGSVRALSGGFLHLRQSTVGSLGVVCQRVTLEAGSALSL